MGKEPTASRGLRRALGPGVLTVLVVGDILGAGIYVLVGEVAAEVGGLLWVPFLMAFALAGLTASSYVELVTAHPHAAGTSRYVEVAFNRPAFTFVVGFVVAASAMTTAAAVSRAVGGQYLVAFGDLPTVPVALATVVLLSLVVWVGIAESSRANVVMTAVEVGGLLVVIAAGIGGLVDGTSEPSRLLEGGGSESGVFAFLGVTALAFFAYLGFEDAVHLAEEVKKPRRSFPIALFAGLAVVGILYLAVTLSAGSIVEPAELGRSETPLLAAIETGPVPISAEVFALIATTAVANTALLALTTASRQVYGLAEQGAAPAALARIGRRQTPTVAIVAVSAVVAVLVATGGVRELADTTVALLLAVFATVNVTVLVLRRRTTEAQETEAPFRTPSTAAVLGALGSSALLVNSLVVGGLGLLLRLASLLGLALLLYLITRRRIG
ncbi:MAG: APC family permease [Actinomycetia bacterium]|nr:APC family permease [Actinomycetes bacterium]